MKIGGVFLFGERESRDARNKRTSKPIEISRLVLPPTIRSWRIARTSRGQKEPAETREAQAGGPNRPGVLSPFDVGSWIAFVSFYDRAYVVLYPFFLFPRLSPLTVKSPASCETGLYYQEPARSGFIQGTLSRH